MASASEVRMVIEANKSRQNRARQLNIRAEKQVFPVLDQAALEAWLRERLDGVVSLGSITDPEKLRLPELDEAQVATVVRENPDKINLLDWEFDVVYEGIPSIKLLGGDQMWKELPDAGVRLPSGRDVCVAVPVDWYNCISDTNIPQLKRKVREHLNAQQWDQWQKPELAVPDLGVEGAAIPEISTVQYGTCVVDGTPLNAFGTLVVNSYYYYATDARFKTAWFRNKQEAEQARATAVAKLETIRVTERERRELETVKATAEALQARLDELYRVLQSGDGERTLQQRVYERRYYDCVPSEIAGVRQWNVETERLVSEASAAVADVESRNARRAAFDEAAQSYGRGQVYLLVDGSLTFVNCGKQSKLGSFEVDPRGASGSRSARAEALDAEHKNCVWQAIPVGRQVQCRDYSSRGGLNSEVTFIVPVGLADGVWALGEDENGKFFFPVIYFENGREIVPEKMEIVREPKPREEERKATATADLMSKWGSGNRTPPKTAKRRY